MKFILSILLLLCIKTTTEAQTLGKNALYIKTEYNSLYESNIKKYALLKWEDDFSMVVYEINKQSDALTDLVEEFESKNTNILYKAVIKWSHDTKSEGNIKKWNAITKCDLASLLKFECDWSMVLYEYQKQVKAKSEFIP
jgi:hypothetical protein